MMESSDTKSSTKMKIKSWQWSIILFGFMLLYLVLGAFIFDFAETQNSFNAQQTVYDDVVEFYHRHPCLGYDFTIMQEFGNNITQYLSRGASLRQPHWKLDARDDTVETTWTPPTAVVFALTIITTIGYGNIVPRTLEGKLFCVFYALIGIPLTAFTLSVFGKSLEGFVKKYKKAMHLLKTPIRSKRPRMAVQVILTVSLVAFSLVLLPALLLSHFEDWPYFEAIYFVFITVSTIGFGDVVLGCPGCSGSVWIPVAIFAAYVFCGMCVITALFSAITTYQRRKFQEAESLLVTLLNTANSTILTTTRADDEGTDMARNRDLEAVDLDIRCASTDRGTHDHNHEILAVDVHNVQSSPYPFVQARMSVNDSL